MRKSCVFLICLFILISCTKNNEETVIETTVKTYPAISNKAITLKLLQEHKLTIIENSNQAVSWISSDPLIIAVDQYGNLTAKKTGRAQISVAFDKGAAKDDSIEIEVVLDPMYFFEMFHIEKTLRKEVSSFGFVTRRQYVNGSVSLYWSGSLNLETALIAVNDNQYTGQTSTAAILEAVEPLKKIRPGIYLEELKYITFHDTENNDIGADAGMHAKFLTGRINTFNRARSWHYTVDSTKVIQHIPDNEVAWQGDSYESYAKSIGIETCINYGSDLYAVWQRMGKLLSMLLNKYNLELDAIEQHYDWNLKNCPKTLRMNNLYQTVIDMAQAEYLVEKYLSGYDISFISLNTEFVNHQGKVIKAPLYDTEVGYIVNIKNDKTGYDETKTFFSIVSGIEN